MTLERRIDALESSLEFKRGGKRYDMSMLSDYQLALIERAASTGAEIDGTNYLNVADCTDDELAEIEKALWLAGVLRKGEQFI